MNPRPFEVWTHQWLWVSNTLAPSRVDGFALLSWTDASWAPADRDEICGYFANCPVHLCGMTPPYSCCLCNYGLEYVWRWDGKFLWPHDLVHFVERHSFRPPNAFIEHIRRSNFQCPARSDVDFSVAEELFDRMLVAVDSD